MVQEFYHQLGVYFSHDLYWLSTLATGWISFEPVYDNSPAGHLPGRLNVAALLNDLLDDLRVHGHCHGYRVTGLYVTIHVRLSHPVGIGNQLPLWGMCLDIWFPIEVFRDVSLEVGGLNWDQGNVCKGIKDDLRRLRVFEEVEL